MNGRLSYNLAVVINGNNGILFSFSRKERHILVIGLAFFNASMLIAGIIFRFDNIGLCRCRRITIDPAITRWCPDRPRIVPGIGYKTITTIGNGFACFR